ncbi:uncharacterized protein MONOS_1916 [Monocercomonoides exilis]|uniref:uncharacterized protein n=1 Tax=Monocercomonoides exilis TaxID=2049356 RepID=UPI00355976F4|nr:hypothetical protein MONOS_1916 [Monocercomonoides exilis]|eukprot:MONOS_1916.1-p1 / transcript=MONOS_1916.1 / gene=MONOS_1916 / organism=Monocercomonoides_exilis_PA203 / gene_product=unspecified product / transcript_product=unspecified product / location=Mono_scaffold00036:167328-168021(-) / protein_length=209 / sequence_SO=supercontig / SO=protein_coding / is_pseudo=false
MSDENTDTGKFEMLTNSTVIRVARETACSEDPNVRMAGPAVMLLNKAATTFIHYLTATAQEITAKKGRSTMGYTDIVEAIGEMGMTHLLDELQPFIQEIVESKRKPNPTSPPLSPTIPSFNNAANDQEQPTVEQQEPIEEAIENSSIPEILSEEIDPVDVDAGVAGDDNEEEENLEDLEKEFNEEDDEGKSNKLALNVEHIIQNEILKS